MAIIRREQHKTNEGQRAKIKDCKRTSGKSSISGKRSEESRRTRRNKKNGGASVKHRRSEERGEKRGSQKRPEGVREIGKPASATGDLGGRKGNVGANASSNFVVVLI